jgi:hypothetical protein
MPKAPLVFLSEMNTLCMAIDENRSIALHLCAGNAGDAPAVDSLYDTGFSRSRYGRERADTLKHNRR